MTPLSRETGIALCPTCGGTGECFANPSAPDPRGETSDTCPTCLGTGRPPAYKDATAYDAMRDEQAEYFGEVPEDTDFAFHRCADVSARRNLGAVHARPVDPQAPPAFSSRSAALADTSTRPDAWRRAA